MRGIWHQTLRNRKIWTLSLILFLSTAYYIFANENGLVLLMDGQPLVLVENKSQVDNAAIQAKNEIAKEYSAKILGFADTLDYEGKKVKSDDQAISEEQLVSLFKDKLNWKVQSWVITINREPRLYLSSEDGAMQALEMVKKQYLPSDNTEVTVENVTFQEDVQVLTAEAYLKQIITPERAGEILFKGVSQPVPYKVKNGDSLWTIARDNNVTVAQLQEANPQLKDFINVGDNINLVKTEPLLTVISTIKKTVEERIPYTTEYQNDSNLRKGQQFIKQNGIDGSHQVTYQITAINGVETGRETLAEKIVLQPLSRIVIRGTKTVVVSRGGGGSGRLAWPLRGPITSAFGYRGKEFHQAIDIDGVTGDPVSAAEAGIVISAGWEGNYGKSIVIDHGAGLTTRYSHLSEMTVSKGNRVKRGALIGKVGSTGRSTGSHLDFEVRVNGSPHNPLSYLK